MNQTEAAYADELERRRLSGQILRWDFEPVKLRLGERCTYSPDFRVISLEHYIEFHEVKGFWRDDARVKIKVAAEMHPMYKFIAVQKVAKKRGGGWKVEEF